MATINPLSMTPAEAAELFNRATSSDSMTVEMVEQDIAEGAPVNADGTINVVVYGAWLLREMKGRAT